MSETTRGIEIFKLDDAKVHKLALETRNERMTKEDQADRANLPKSKYKQDYKRRALTGGPLTFLEAKYMVREQLTFDKWRIEFYEVANLPQVRLFETEYPARKYWERIQRRQGVKAQEATLMKPAEHIFAERPVEDEYKIDHFQRKTSDIC